MVHGHDFLNECAEICVRFEAYLIDDLAEELHALRERGGRLFVLGVGGSAANAGHCAADLRKLCGIEAYAPSDNVAELTARANDEGWDTIFSGWLRVSRMRTEDALLVLSVGGGAPGVSECLVRAMEVAMVKKSKIFAILGRDDGFAARHADIAIVIPQVNAARITPLAEAFQAVVWHALVSHPRLQINQTKW